MAIKRGVSLYSYQQAYYNGQLDLEGCVRTAVETTGARGIELIYEQMPLETYPDAIYPNITDKGIGRWKEIMEKYGTVPTCMDSFIDSMIYKGRISYVQEQVQMMEQDLALASKLGFSCIRVLALVAPEVLEQSLPAAEYYGVAMGLEVHPPHSLNSKWMLNVAELARKHNTKYIGLIPDFGIFTTGINGAQLYAAKMSGEKNEVMAYVEDAAKAQVPYGQILVRARELGAGPDVMGALNQAVTMNKYSAPALLRDVADVILHFHGKFYRMDENCEETAINYEEPIRILKSLDWDGYISSEFEGQRSYHGQNCPYEEDEIEQVRRHHEMLKRYIGE